MLILTRRIGETLRIGDEVSLTVLGVQGSQVRIGADAPREISVHREEIYQRIQEEKNPQAPTATPPQPEKGATYYSTEGQQTTASTKKTPNVIVKKKRVIANI